MYLDHGLETSQRIILDLFGTRSPLTAAHPCMDSTEDLAAGYAERGYGPLQYQISLTGPDHSKEFTARAVIAGEELGEGGTQQEGS